MNEKKPVDMHHGLKVSGNSALCQIYGIYVVKLTNKAFTDALLECGIITKTDYQVQHTSYQIRPHINTTGSSISAKSRRLPPD